MEWYVGAEGPANARLAIIAEKPHRNEVIQGRPLVGPTGEQVDNLLLDIGLTRSQVYLTNAVKHGTDYNNPTTAQIKAEQPALMRELFALPNLTCIVPMGNVALLSLSNFTYTGIMNRRGSILQSCLGVKMVPTLHPAFYVRGKWEYKSIVRHDLNRALEESYDREMKLPSRMYNIAPDYSDLEMIEEYFKDAPFISFDIEVLRNRYISCIAFSRDPNEAFCIPLCRGNRSSYWTPAQEAKVWRLIQRLLAQPNTTYVTQNGQFDCWHLYRHGIVTPYMRNGLDTMLMHRYRAPGLPHDLGFLTSIYTREPYYKDESGDWDSDVLVPDDQFWVYNCKDAAVTLEIAMEMSAELSDYGMLDYYKSDIQGLWDVAMSTKVQGIKVSPERMVEVREQLNREVEGMHKQIESLEGWLPNTKSPIDMQKLLENHGIRNYPTTSKGRPRIDKDSINSYAARYDSIRDTLTLTLEVNSRRTLLSTFSSMRLDDYRFYHPWLDIIHAKTLRFSSKGDEPPIRVKGASAGPQIQNIPRYMRKLFIPDGPDWEFTGCDLKQAEQMLVAWEAEDQVLIDAFTQGKDVHRYTACLIFRGWCEQYLPPDELLNSILEVCADCLLRGEKKCNHSERYIGKQSGHAFSYLMGPRRFCTERRKDGIFFTEERAKQIRDITLSKEKKAWQQEWWEAIHRSPWIINSLGLRREFYGLRDEKMHRDILSWRCQSGVSMITNRAMWKLHDTFQGYPAESRPRVVTQTHDSLLICNPIPMRSEVCSLLTNAFYWPIQIKGRELNIPIEISHGQNWGEMG